MSPPPTILLQNPQNPNFFTLFPKFTFPRKLSVLPQTLKLSPRDSIPASISSYSLSSSPLQPNYKEEPDEGEEEEDEEHIIGDCVVFEEGIFQEPYLEQDFHLSATTNPPRKTEIKPESLIPDEWKQVQAEINITKKERREIAQKLEFGRRLEKRRLAMEPIGLESGRGNGSGSVEDRMRKYRDAKLAQLKPLVLDNPSSFPVEKQERNEKGVEELERSEMGRFGSSSSGSRVVPKNPRLAVYGGTLDDITFFFNSGKYNHDAAQKSQGNIKGALGLHVP